MIRVSNHIRSMGHFCSMKPFSVSVSQDPSVKEWRPKRPCSWEFPQMVVKSRGISLQNAQKSQVQCPDFTSRKVPALVQIHQSGFLKISLESNLVILSFWGMKQTGFCEIYMCLHITTPPMQGDRKIPDISTYISETDLIRQILLAASRSTPSFC